VVAITSTGGDQSAANAGSFHSGTCAFVWASRLHLSNLGLSWPRFFFVQRSAPLMIGLVEQQPASAVADSARGFRQLGFYKRGKSGHRVPVCPEDATLLPHWSDD